MIFFFFRMASRKINRRRDYTPVTWDKYYDTYRDIKISDGNVSFLYALLLLSLSF